MSRQKDMLLEPSMTPDEGPMAAQASPRSSGPTGSERGTRIIGSVVVAFAGLRRGCTGLQPRHPYGTPGGLVLECPEAVGEEVPEHYHAGSDEDRSVQEERRDLALVEEDRQDKMAEAL